jgi:hypothetical protein
LGSALTLLLVPPAAIARTPSEVTARAEPQVNPVRLLVTRFTGTHASIARGSVLAALDREVTVDVISVRALESHAKSFDGSPSAYADAGTVLDVRVFITGKLTKSDSGYALRLGVIDGRTGKVQGHVLFEAKGLRELNTVLRNELWQRLTPLVDAHANATDTADTADTTDQAPLLPTEIAPTKAPSSTAPEDSNPAEPNPCALLRFEVGGGTFSRDLRYGGEVPGPLRGHNLRPVPTARFEVTYSPLVHSTCSPWSQLQLRARFEPVLYAHSELAERRLRTIAFDSRGGLAYRMGAPFLYVEPAVDFDLRQIQVDGNYIPNFGYRSLRFGATLGLAISPILVELSGAYHLILSAGDVTAQTWFPLATAYGFEGEGRLGLSLGRAWAVLAGVTLQETRFTLHPDPPYGYPHGIAESLTDRFLTTHLTVRWTLFDR